ncbi:MAG: hydroxymethylbilane synthase [Pseudomonadaceae bacterium]|nr:hydroxymethylbilane synthase [Pseudomonadaceae bacterium]
MSRTFRIASRRSKMALTQTNRIIAALKAVAPQHEYVIHEVVADGDYEKFKGDLQQIGGKGAFVKALEHDMLDGKADMAMHSMKDVPGDVDLPEGLVIPAVLERDDLRDAVVCRVGETFVGLKDGAKVGTSSVRRAAQLKMAFPHLDVVPLRGNADTRVGKVDSGEVDAAVLALAGLRRIGLEGRVSEVFEPDMMLPAVAQGVVAIECKADDKEALELLAKINHADTFACITAERAMLKALQGGCHTPIAGYCVITANRNLRLIAMVSSLDGKEVLRGRNKLPFEQAEELGRSVAEELLGQGARQLLDSCN